jgi:hypothetical protein
MYPTDAICVCWEWDSFFVACRFWLPCYISNKLWTLAISVPMSISSFHTLFQCLLNAMLAHHLPKYHYRLNHTGLKSIFLQWYRLWILLLPADNISTKGKTGLLLNPTSCDKEYVERYIRVTVAGYLNRFCRVNFTAKKKSSLHSVFNIAKPRIMPFIWSNMSL